MSEKLVVLDLECKPEEYSLEQIKGLQEELNYIYFGKLPKDCTKEQGIKLDKSLLEIITKRLNDYKESKNV